MANIKLDLDELRKPTLHNKRVCVCALNFPFTAHKSLWNRALCYLTSGPALFTQRFRSTGLSEVTAAPARGLN